MEKSTKTLISIISACTILACAIILISGMYFPEGFEFAGINVNSTYNYEVEISATGTLKDVTMMFPLASTGDDSPIGIAIVSGKGYGMPAGWKTELVGSDKEIFLKIKTDTISPDGESGEPVTFGATILTDRLIETKNPSDSEFMLAPKTDIFSAGDQTGYKSYIFASYAAKPGTITAIKITATGRNEWWGSNERYNRYTDTISTEITGSATGWTEAEGSLTTGIGKYTLI
ncbi:MAG: hypothetical protein U9N40_01095 [Euryarchaeota archaeon]|nr:hypothetical protein [Euryarchaeota archaeon]